MRRVAALAVVALAVVSAVATPAEARRVNVPTTPAPPAITQPHVADRLIVTYKAGTSATTQAATRSSKRVAKVRRISVTGPVSEVVQLPAGQTVADAMVSLKADPAVQFAEPDYIVQSLATSNDPSFTNGTLWGMQGDASTPANPNGSGAAEAWGAGYTGSSNVVVGVIDEGIQASHPDLAANIWTNPGEIAGDGIDNDGNGYIDDVNGWDFFTNDATIFDGATNPSIDSHGTHVAGTIGGVGNNGQGVAGVNWSVKMISAKFLGAGGGSISAAISAVNYLVDAKIRHGANIVAINNSWGGGGFSATMAAAINRAGDAGILFVAAAGNSGTNNDTSANYPSNYECTNGGTRGWDCVVAVAATDRNGALASFSQFGASTVDLGAPGVAITSTVPNNSYASYDGTSMASPHVAGAAALCASMDPTLSAPAIRSALMGSAAPTAALNGRSVTGGRLDIGTMTQYCLVPTQPVSGGPTGLVATASAEDSISLAWTDGALYESRYEIERASAVAGTCGTFALVGQAPGNTASYSVSGLPANTQYCFRVRAVNGFNGLSASAYSNVAPATTLAPPPPYVCTDTPFSWVDATLGTQYVLGDDASVNVNLPFGVSFYGTNYTTAVISSNGYLRLGSGAAIAHINSTIPMNTDPNGFIAPWWDDLDPSAGGGVWVRTVGSAPNRQYVVSWNGVPHFTGGAGTAVSFQLVLNESTGVVLLQYLDAATGNSANDRGASATVGLEHPSGLRGTQVSYQSGTIADSSAKACSNTPGGTPVFVQTAALPSGTSTVGYSSTVAAAGGTAPYTWSVSSGALPTGLVLNPATGVISGTPTATGSFPFTVMVSDSGSASASKALSITVGSPVSITTASLAGGAASVAYSQTLGASGGTTPYVWSMASGTLNAGLTLNANTGEIRGTPTTAGTSSFTVRVTDAASRSVTRALSITISAPPGAFAKSAPRNNATGSSRTALRLSWAASTNAVRYEYCVDSVNNGVCDGSWVGTGSSRSVTIGGLLSRTAYFWQVRAVNATGATTNANSGTWWRFTTAR